MTFTWHQRYVLRAVEEKDPQHHVIYKHSASARDISDADNVATRAPALASRKVFDARRVNPAEQWQLYRQGNPALTVAVFQLWGA